MDNLTMLQAAKERYKVWLREREHEGIETDFNDVEDCLSVYLYGALVDLHRKYDATNEQIGEFVRMFNDFIEAEMAKF